MAKKKIKTKGYTPTRGRFAGRTFKSRHIYRNEMARVKGFRNYYEERIAYKPLPSRKRIESQSRVVQQKRADAFEVLSIMRRSGVNLRPAIRIFNKENPGTPITARTVKKYVKPSLKKKSGKWVTKRYDRLMRLMQMPTKTGVIEIEVRDSRSATKIAHYWNAVRHFLITGETDQLKQFRYEYITSGKLQYRFITDPETLLRLADFGEFRFESIYQEISMS
jgi:hypothetical protein